MFAMNEILWEIWFVDSRSPYLMRSDGTYTLGVTDGYLHRVYLNNKLSGYMLDKVLAHELCHCASFSYSLDIDIETEELIADFLATYGREIFAVADDILGRLAMVS